jgi:hypothetical protein
VIPDNQDSSKYIMVLCEDIIERKRMEADLEDSHQKVLRQGNLAQRSSSSGQK